MEGRVAVLLAFRKYKSRPHQVYLPVCYEDELRFLYSDIDDERTLVTCEGKSPVDEVTETAITIFDFAQVARITAGRIGCDFQDRVEKLERQALDQGVVVIQVWLPLRNDYADYAVNLLRSLGYFLGGILPRWFDEDGIMMQKVLVDPYFEGIQLYSDRSKKIMEMIKSDWERSRMF